MAPDGEKDSMYLLILYYRVRAYTSRALAPVAFESTERSCTVKAAQQNVAAVKPRMEVDSKSKTFGLRGSRLNVEP